MANPEAFYQTRQFEHLYDAEAKPRDVNLEVLETDLVLNGLRMANIAWAAATSYRQYDEVAARKAYNVAEACYDELGHRAPEHVGDEWKSA